MGRSAPTVAAETFAGWLPGRTAGPVVVVAGPVVVGAAPVVVGLVVVVGPVVGAMLVVVTSVVVDAAVVDGAVVVGPTVVDGAVMVGWVVVAARTEGAVTVVVPPTVAGAWAVAGPVVVVGVLTARRPGLGVVEGGGVVVGSRGAVVVVDADVGAGLVGIVGSATPGARRRFGLGEQGGRGHQGSQGRGGEPEDEQQQSPGPSWPCQMPRGWCWHGASSWFGWFFRLIWVSRQAVRLPGA